MREPLTDDHDPRGAIVVVETPTFSDDSFVIGIVTRGWSTDDGTDIWEILPESEREPLEREAGDCRVMDEERFSELREALIAHEGGPSIDDLVKLTIETLPEKTTLVYVNQGDRLTDEQITSLLEGDMESVYESMSEWEWENKRAGVDYHWTEALNRFTDEDAERLREDDNAFERFREECEERDDSDPLGDLIRGTPNVMIRYRLDHTVDPRSFDPDEEITEEAQAIAKAAGIDYEENVVALRSLVIEASYGGDLCVLHSSDLEDVAKMHDGDTVVFTDPNLLVYDGMNGSGHCEDVKGTVTVKLTEDTMRHDTGRMSWSDGIAGVVHSYFETPIQHIPAETKENAC